MKNKLFRPGYFRCFECAADRCLDSCCRSGWEIPLDDETYRLYKSACAEDLDDNLMTGSDGDRIFRLKDNGDCPYLDNKGLCRLYTLTGGALGEICKKYPRFTEEYDGFTEEGLSISCPEAQRLILKALPEDYSFTGEAPEEELLAFLHSARSKAFQIIFDKSPCETAAARLIDFGAYLELSYSCANPEALERVAEYKPKSRIKLLSDDYSYIAEIILTKTDILYPKWRELLERAAKGEIKERAFDARIGRRYLAYLVFRFFLKAVNRENIKAVCEFIAASYILVTRLPGDFCENARLFSKEIEHDAENYEAIVSQFELLA